MAFTREAVFLKWGASHYCFFVGREGYQGGNEEKAASYSRGLYDGSLLRVFAASKPRQFSAALIVDDVRPGLSYDDGTETLVQVGNIADLKAAWAATDLQVKSFEDSAYWGAEWQGPWRPQLAFDPNLNTAEILMTLVER